MQISEILDDKIFFLDIKFPNYPAAMDVFQNLFVKYAKDNKHPLTTRPSFSFINSSLTTISSSKGSKLRMNVGLENIEVLDSYASFFKRVQKALKVTKKDLQKENVDNLLANRLQDLKF